MIKVILLILEMGEIYCVRPSSAMMSTSTGRRSRFVVEAEDLKQMTSIMVLETCELCSSSKLQDPKAPNSFNKYSTGNLEAHLFSYV